LTAPQLRVTGRHHRLSRPLPSMHVLDQEEFLPAWYTRGHSYRRCALADIPSDDGAKIVTEAAAGKAPLTASSGRSPAKGMAEIVRDPPTRFTLPRGLLTSIGIRLRFQIMRRAAGTSANSIRRRTGKKATFSGGPTTWQFIPHLGRTRKTPQHHG
jgi:hypothetical protein